MSRLLLFVVLFAFALLQFSVFPKVAPFGAAPNVLFLILFFRFTRCGVQEALIWTFTFGFILDVLAMDRLGMHALAMIPMVIAVQPLRQRPWLVNPISVMVLIAGAALFHNLFLGVMRGGVNLGDVAIQTGMQLMIAPLGYVIYRRIYKR